jgi:hypothetical protein
MEMDRGKIKINGIHREKKELADEVAKRLTSYPSPEELTLPAELTDFINRLKSTYI